MLRAGVEHPVELPVQFVGRIVFDAPKRECPSARYGAYPASNFAPVPKVALCAVVGDVAGLVRGDCYRAAFAFGSRVVVVQITGANGHTAEVAGHISHFSFRFGIGLKEPLSG
jgi:hypothetical protein